jgi:hypothetical protein
MIITKLVEIKITKRNINHFILFYKDIKLKDKIKIKPIELQKNSNIKIDVKCDICGVERNIKYQAYNKNINSCEEYPIYTCDKCSHVKIKQTNLKKYGVDHFSKTHEYNDKFTKTMVERYGVEYSTQSREIQEKIKQTNLERYGVDNIFKDNVYIKEKFKKKYGVDHPSKVPKIYKKIENSNLITTGYKSPLSSPSIRKSFKNKYKVNSPNQTDELRDNIITNDINYIKYIGNNVSMFNCIKNHIFYIDSSNYHNRIRSKIPLCTVCNPIGNSSSIKENELYEFIKSIYSGEIKQGYRDKYEIDIYLPDLKIGFEFNGLYWHSEEYKDKNYHLMKTNHFKGKSIKIIHIWEDDWLNKTQIIKSQIKNQLGLTKTKIFGRKCVIKEISKSKISSEFLNKNHIQGTDKSIIKIGLYHNDELVSLMTFNKSEGRKKMPDNEWNLSRFCNKLDTNILGGASKLLKYFINNHQAKRIISYADKDWSVGGLYYNLGFELISESKPDYKYIVNNTRVHKSRYGKSKLKTNLTESQEMKKSHINKIWDCGKLKFEIFT